MTKTKKTTKKSYNWDKLKAQFLISKYKNVSERRRNIQGTEEVPENWNFKKQTKWWAEEKAEIRKQAIQETKEEIKESYKPDIEELNSLHKDAIWLIKLTLHKMKGGKAKITLEDWNTREISDVDIGDLEKIWKIIKVEKNEPIKFTEEKLKATISQWLDEEEKTKLDTLLNNL